MLAVLLSWIITSFVFISLGSLSLNIYTMLTGNKNQYLLIDTLLIGLCSTSAIIAICSLVIPANSYLLIAILTICTIYWIVNRKEFNNLYFKIKNILASLNKWQIILLVIPTIIFLLHSVTAPLWVDSPYYHVQNIMWNEQYHVVPGLANLQPRFGFNSNYYLLCSTFGLKPLFGQYIFGVQQLCYVSIFTWIIYRSFKDLSIPKAFVSLFIITTFIVVYKLHFTSPSSDFLPNLLIVYLFIKMILNYDSINKYPLIFVCIPVFCLTLKLSSFIICIFSAVVLYNSIRKKEIKNLSFFVLMGALIFIPWLVRTIIITGYLVYPYPAIDIFSFDWKVPVQYVQDQKDYILAFARIDGAPIEEVLALPITEWVPRWWESGMFYYTPFANRLFSFLILLSPLTMLGLFSISQKIRKSYLHIFSLWLVALVAIIFWFLSAPDFRFAYGFIIPFCYIPFYIMIDSGYKNKKVGIKKVIMFSYVIPLFAISIVAVQAIKWSKHKRDKSKPRITLLYKPQTIDYTKKLKEKQFGSEIQFIPEEVNNMIIYSANFETHCYDCPLPCGSDYTGGIEMRGRTLQDGFRSRPDGKYRKTY